MVESEVAFRLKTVGNDAIKFGNSVNIYLSGFFTINANDSL